MPKFRVPVENLPPPNINGRHLFRFRVASEDRNRISQYSPLFTIESKGQIYPLQTTAVVNVSTSEDAVNIYWETPIYYNVGASAVGASVQHNHTAEYRVHDADVFVSWDSAEFIYYGRTSTGQINLVKPASNPTFARVIGQVANYPPTRSDKFKIFDTGQVRVK
jgi:hypothetical protein